MISIQYELTATERAFLRQQLTVLGMRYRFWLFVLGSFWFSTAFLFSLKQNPQNVAVWFLLPAALLLGFAAAFAIVSVWQTMRIAARAEVVFDRSGVHQTKAGGLSLNPWAAIDAITETGDFLIVLPRRMIPIAIPKRSISNLQDLWLAIDTGRVGSWARVKGPKSSGLQSLVYTLSDAEYRLGLQQKLSQTTLLSNAGVFGIYIGAAGSIFHNSPHFGGGILAAVLLVAWLLSKWLQLRPARAVDIDIDWIGIGALFNGRPFSAPWSQIRSVTDFRTTIVMRVQNRDSPIVIPKRVIPDISEFRTLVDDRLRGRKLLIKKLQRTLNVRAQRLERDDREYKKR